MGLRYTPSIQELVKDKTKVFIVSPCIRPGAQLFSTKLEYEHFPPRTSLNELFNIMVVPWEGMNFYIFILPASDLATAKKIATSINMQVTDGLPAVPHMVSGKLDFKFFPAKGDNVYSLTGAFEGDERAETNKVLDADQAKMQDDFHRLATIKESTLAELQDFVQLTYETSYYSPSVAIMFGGKRLADTKTILAAYIGNTPFGVATLSEEGELLGLFVIPSRRGWGYGMRLVAAACKLCKQRQQHLKINPLSKEMGLLVGKLPKELQDNIQLSLFTCKEDMGELDALFFKNPKWFTAEGCPG